MGIYRVSCDNAMEIGWVCQVYSPGDQKIKEGAFMKDKQLNVELKVVTEKRRLDQALSIKEFAVANPGT